MVLSVVSGMTWRSQMCLKLPQHEADSIEVVRTLLASQCLAEAGMDQVQYGVKGQPNVLYPPQNGLEKIFRGQNLGNISSTSRGPEEYFS